MTPQGYALVEYHTKQEAQAAIDAMDGKDILGQVGGRCGCVLRKGICAGGCEGHAGWARARPHLPRTRQTHRTHARRHQHPCPPPSPRLSLALQVVQVTWAFSSGPLRKARR